MKRKQIKKNTRQRRNSDEVHHDQQPKQKEVIVLHRLNYMNKLDFEDRNVHISKD